jgi:hypothetical protein
MKKLLTSVAMAAALSFGGASMAHAATYILNADGCTGGCGLTNYGTVTTTGEGTTSLGVSIQLAANVFFNMSGTPEEAFDLAGNPQIHIAGITDPPWNVHNDQIAGAVSEPSLGNYEYRIDWDGTFQNANHPGNGFPSSNGCLPACGIQTLNFTVTPTNGTTQLTPDFTTNLGKNIYFTVDVAKYDPTLNSGAGGVLNTGNVGATLGGVPEPATWAIMLVGFGGLGAALRRQRRQAAVLA